MLKALCAVYTIEAMLLFLHLAICEICPSRQPGSSEVLCGVGRRWIVS